MSRKFLPVSFRGIVDVPILEAPEPLPVVDRPLKVALEKGPLPVMRRLVFYDLTGDVVFQLCLHESVWREIAPAAAKGGGFILVNSYCSIHPQVALWIPWGSESC